MFKKLVKSFFISGSIAQFFNIVFPLAKVAARIAFSVAPTDILGKKMFEPVNFDFAKAFTYPFSIF